MVNISHSWSCKRDTPLSSMDDLGYQGWPWLYVFAISNLNMYLIMFSSCNQTPKVISSPMHPCVQAYCAVHLSTSYLTSCPPIYGVFDAYSHIQHRKPVVYCVVLKILDHLRYRLDYELVTRHEYAQFTLIPHNRSSYIERIPPKGEAQE